MRYCECPFPKLSDPETLSGLPFCKFCLGVIEDELVAEDQRNEDYDQTMSDWHER
jgi:hypothetical protein